MAKDHADDVDSAVTDNASKDTTVEKNENDTASESESVPSEIDETEQKNDNTADDDSNAVDIE